MQAYDKGSSILQEIALGWQALIDTRAHCRFCRQRLYKADMHSCTLHQHAIVAWYELWHHGCGTNFSRMEAIFPKFTWYQLQTCGISYILCKHASINPGPSSSGNIVRPRALAGLATSPCQMWAAGPATNLHQSHQPQTFHQSRQPQTDWVLSRLLTGTYAHAAASLDSRTWRPATGFTFLTWSTSPPLSNTAAAPMPLPMHMLTTPKRAPGPRRPISFSNVAVMRAPVHPRGCPKAMAPPLGLTCKGKVP